MEKWTKNLPSASEFSIGGRSVDQYPFRTIVKCVWWTLLFASVIPSQAINEFISRTVFTLFTLLIIALKFSSHWYYHTLPANPEYFAFEDGDCNKSRFKVLSLNFYLRAGGISDLDGDHKNERLNGFLEQYVHDYDILVLQEVFSTMAPRRNYLIHHAKTLGFKYHAVSPPPKWLSFACYDAGLLVLSRFPIHESVFLEYNDYCYSDSMSNKGALYVDILIKPNTHFHVFNTHLQATYSLQDPTAENIQMKQLLQLAKFTKSLQDNQIPSLLCADLNIDANPPLTLQDEGRVDDGTQARSEMYQLLSSNLSVECIDLMYHQHNKHYPTCKSNFDTAGADVGTRPRTTEERQMKNYVELGMTLDYQFFRPVIEVHPCPKSVKEQRNIKHVYTSEPVELPLPHIPYYAKASDHWGIESTFEV